MLAQVNGTTLYYEKTGTGRPLMLVHGNGEDHTIFDEAVAVLRQHYTCYTPDSRGHGQSAPAKDLHYADMAADAVALIRSLELRDVAFYGFSDGGIVGLLAAAQSDAHRAPYPGRASRAHHGEDPCAGGRKRPDPRTPDPPYRRRDPGRKAPDPARGGPRLLCRPFTAHRAASHGFSGGSLTAHSPYPICR